VRHDDPTWLSDALAPLPDLSAAVFGDFCLDAYWQLDAGRVELSIETGLPVQRVRQQRYSLGGAGNVVANLIDLGVGQVRAIGIVGTDPFGAELMRLLRARGAVVDAGMISDEAWQTLVYAKPITAEAEGRRMDFGGFNVLADHSADALITALDSAASTSKVVVLNQQIPLGVSTAPVITKINAIIARHPQTLFLADSRHRPKSFAGAALKLNSEEAARFLGASGQSGFTPEDVEQFALRISAQIGQPAFITRGEHGIVAADGPVVHHLPGIQILGRSDAVGAGDTVVAALAAMLGSRQSPLIAARVANIAAMITTRKLQTTGTATRAEILADGVDADYIYAPEIAAMPHLAHYAPGSAIEIVRPLPGSLAIRVCIFDHDGTLSTLREGWEVIMEAMMLRAVLGENSSHINATRAAEVQREVRQFIDQSAGVQTLAQMHALIGLVRKFGYVQGDAILDAAGYKRLFNEELMKVVDGRMEQLRSGQLGPEHFQIRNAALFLRELHHRGVILYLASGTDHADVVAEAEALGYAGYFDGRIFGAGHDLRGDAKRMVLERMMGEHGLSGHQFAMFGDGPLEIRETRKRGGVAIGIASDEARAAGVNPSKRKRLVRAGADLVIADYSSYQSLLEMLRL
jgi:rfaE bifunctional protein kinase chain/domain